MAKKVRQILEEYKDKIVSQIKDRIIQRDLVASRDLLDSISAETTDRSIIVSAIDYATFVDEGRGPGRRPPVNKILEWVEFKNLESNNDKYKKHRDMAWAIANGIAKFGTIKRFDYQGGDFIDYVNDNIVASLTEELQDGYLEDLNNELDVNS
tara:strand:- start:3396 stop:3854 length:459 start_codon:yes stop_codon:yes gene_type:complete